MSGTLLSNAARRFVTFVEPHIKEFDIKGASARLSTALADPTVKLTKTALDAVKKDLTILKNGLVVATKYAVVFGAIGGGIDAVKGVVLEGKPDDPYKSILDKFAKEVHTRAGDASNKSDKTDVNVSDVRKTPSRSVDALITLSKLFPKDSSQAITTALLAVDSAASHLPQLAAITAGAISEAATHVVFDELSKMGGSYSRRADKASQRIQSVMEANRGNVVDAMKGFMKASAGSDVESPHGQVARNSGKVSGLGG